MQAKTAELIALHKHHWRREASAAGAEAWLARLVLDRLRGLALVETDGSAVRPRAAVGRFALRASPALAPLGDRKEPDVP